MKKIIIIAMLVAVSSSAMAQDTILTLNDLRNTNEAVITINDALRRHAKMAMAGTAVTALGTILLATHSSSGDVQHDKNMQTLYAATVTGGLLLVAASYTPLLRNKIRFDGRGLVFDIPQKKPRGTTPEAKNTENAPQR